jgi:hypothetical protein
MSSESSVSHSQRQQAAVPSPEVALQPGPAGIAPAGGDDASAAQAQGGAGVHLAPSAISGSTLVPPGVPPAYTSATATPAMAMAGYPGMHMGSMAMPGEAVDVSRLPVPCALRAFLDPAVSHQIQPPQCFWLNDGAKSC